MKDVLIGPNILICFVYEPAMDAIWPEGAKVRYRQRPGKTLRAFVRVGNVTSHYYVGRNPQGEFVLFEVGSNIKARTSA